MQVEVAFSGLEEKGDIKSEISATPMKVLPPWMIKEGMNLTKEQRGEVKQESNMEGSSAAAGSSDDKKSIETEDVKNIKVKLIAFCMVPNLFLPFLLFCPFLSCLNSSMLFNDALMPHLFFCLTFGRMNMLRHITRLYSSDKESKKKLPKVYRKHQLQMEWITPLLSATSA